MSSLRLRQEGRLLKAKYPLGLTPRILQRRWTGKSFFAASMKRNFIDFPPWRKKLRPFSGSRALPQNFVLTPQPLQLRGEIFLALWRRRLHLALSMLVDPATQRRKANAKIDCDLALRPTARLDKADGLLRKLLREPSLRLAHEALLFLSKELSTFLRQVHTRPTSIRIAR